MSCALSPVVDDESADLAAHDFQVEDATVSPTEKGALSDAGLARADAVAQGREGSSFEYDARAEAQARGSAYSEPTDASLTPDASAPSSSVADASASSSETSPASSTPAPVVTPKQPSSLAPADSAVPARPSASTDAGVSPAKPVPTPQPVVADAGPAKTSPRVDAGSATNQARCVAGRYTGAFRGQIVRAQLGTVVLTGTVTLQLALSTDGRTLDVTSGAVEATDAVGTPIHADIDGTVDCTTNQIKSGTLRGNYGTPASDNNAFAGTVDGSYDPAPPAKLRGTWTVPLTDASATGSYEATLQD